MQTALWDGRFHLWRCGIYSDIKEAFGKAKTLFTTGAVAAKLEQMPQVTAPVSTTNLSPISSSVAAHD